MAFGGFFGGGSSKDNSSSSTTSSSSSSSSSDSSSTSITNPLSSSFSPSSGSTTTTTSGVTLQRIQSAISEQSNVANAKQLISNVHTNCFEKCVPNPGSSLSSTEQKCLTACMEKYIDAWNVTSRTYTARLQRESASFAGGIAAGSGAAGGGKELF
ncbi:uncharacterized protein Z520_08459 [Fonsecaea multimorphosa CBS 102226]|uniref:Mitochondrial import inner membrane translocase subunit TIM13 n=1 Tax=Fonsecaea multimorphosa CBS 102226 TaxID=1442371 RepID=A0A0D2IF68_9EURO|nr:uncharacterized protein Z520_08459 [Fonsecaea multimorphosa CBS 102226]KIX95751.1 hypothetical protein Z520_08459 [Fonsecaea multimorphosa CBS 102226]OAL21488.1 hypothetical protein AYO22_07884 [Fonsecaea multimorphosa]